MSKPIATLSNRIIFKPINEDYRDYIVANTTYNIEDEYRTLKMGKPVFKTIRTYNNLHGGKLSIPIGRIDLVEKEYDFNDVRTFSEVSFPSTNSILRDSQAEVCNEVTDNCIINAPVGWGKTITALHIAKKLKQRTLVITHNTILRAQWEKEILNIFGITPGIIGGGKLVELDKAITVSNIQTLVKNLPAIAYHYGLIIVDECHHTPATTFTETLNRLNARYKIGLTGTLARVDGQEVLFREFFSKLVYRPEIENTLEPEIVVVNSGLSIPQGDNWANRTTELIYTPEYQKLITGLATKMADRGHYVLVISDRIQFLEDLAERTKEKYNSVCITGSSSNIEDRELLTNKIVSGESKILFGTRSIFSEGVSINRLSCLILASPVANNINLTQLIGRIQRTYPNKKTPIVIDIKFLDNTGQRQLKNRMEHYISKGYKVFMLEKFIP